MKKALLLSLFTLTTLAGHADEGMWMLTDLKEQNAATMYDMGLDISIDKVYCPDSISLKDAVVHFGGGCTGEIISAEGLVDVYKRQAYKCGFKIAEVPVIFVNRELGTSKMNGSIFGEAVLGVIQLKLGS